MTTHAGSFDTLPQAYEALLPQVLAMRGVQLVGLLQLVGLPAVEFYHGPSVDTSLEINHTDIALPVRCWPAGA